MNVVSAQKVAHDAATIFKIPSLLHEDLLNLHEVEITWPNNTDFVEIAKNYLQKNPPSALVLNRLGHYFEYLFGLVFTQLSDHYIVLKNFRLPNDHNAGEIDLITQHTTNGQFYHWELAYKLYLNIGSGHHLSDFVGPSRKDNLDTKWKKLIRKQIPFAQHPEVTKALAEQNIHIAQSGLFVKGMLFYHPAKGNSIFPDLIHPYHERGWWIYAHEIGKYFENSGRWKILNRLHRIGDALEVEEISTQTLKLHLQQNPPQPIMVAQILENNLMSKGFIVPKNWGIG